MRKAFHTPNSPCLTTLSYLQPNIHHPWAPCPPSVSQGVIHASIKPHQIRGFYCTAGRGKTCALLWSGCGETLEQRHTAARRDAIMSTQGLSIGHLTAGTLRLVARNLATVPFEEVEPLSDRLTGLDLTGNVLGPGFTLPPLPALVELRLADNLLDAATVQRAAPLPATLRVLDLSRNTLVLLPPCVLRLRSLSLLKLDKQQLRALPAELSLLVELTELDASFNELASALELQSPGLPKLRRLLLRSNRLSAERLSLDSAALPTLTELDLAGNVLATWPADVGRLEGLRTLNVSNNQLSTLVSSQTVPHRRMWVPASGIHTLEQLVELSVAQNGIVDLPASLMQLRQIRRLDARCNPLSRASHALASSHCAACGATMLATSISRATAGVLLGDESSAWHRPTLLRANVGRVLAIGRLASDGVAASRLVSKHPNEASLLGLLGGAGRAPPGPIAGGPLPAGAMAGPVPSASPDGAACEVVDVESLRRAFHAAALRLHPDKQPEAGRPAAAAAFSALQEAYRTLGRAVAVERRRMPELASLRYHSIDLPDRAAAGPVAFREQLPAALAFANDAAAASGGGELIVLPAAGASPEYALAATLAIAIDRAGGALSLTTAKAELAAALGRPSLDMAAPLHAELHAFALECSRRGLHVERSADASVDATASALADEAADEATDEATRGERVPRGPSGAPRGAPRAAPRSRRYDPDLTISDPFGADADPFAPFAADPSAMAAETATVADVELNGGMHELDLTDASDGAAMAGDCDDADAPTGASGSRPLAAAAGAAGEDLTLDTAESMVFSTTDAEATSRPGWHVDSQGRDVLSVPGGRRFTSVTVEYEPGARVRTGGATATHSFVG